MSVEYKKVALEEEIKVSEVKVNGQSVVDPQTKTANITITPQEQSVAGVTVDGVSVVDQTDKIAKIVKDLKTKTDEFPLAFEDAAGNVAFAITSEGHIKSKLFDSSDIHAGVEDVKLDGTSVVDANHIAQLTSPTIPVTDVQVDNTSVLQGTVAKITQPLKTSAGDPPFAIKDENDNVVLQVDSNGHLQVKSFDSSQLNTIIQGVVALMQGQGITISNNKINSNIIYEEIGGASSPIVGTGTVGSMIIA